MGAFGFVAALAFRRHSRARCRRRVVLGTFLVVLVAASGPSVLVPRSNIIYPAWEAGPLHTLVPLFTHNPKTMGIVYSVMLVALFGAYAIALASVRTLSMRVIVGAVVALELILLLSPPLQLNDVFNYIGYARLGGLHHLNPYTHVIKQEFFDPVYRFSSWHNLRSPYGSLFTAITYPLALLALPIAYWGLKLMTVALSLAFLALVYKCARQLGRDPRFALVFVALNPIYLLYAVGGFHNDFFMLIPSMGAISLLLAGRERAAGAAIVIAIAVKFTAVLLLPFLLVAALTRPRRMRMLAGAALAAVPMIALQLALFGLAIPNLSDQSALLTDFSLPNIVGPHHRRRRRRPRAPAGRQRGGRARGRFSGLPPSRLAIGRRVVHVRAHRQPRLAGPVVHHLAAAAGCAGRQHQPAPRRPGHDRVPDLRVHARHRPVLLGPRHRPSRQLRGPGLEVAINISSRVDHALRGPAKLLASAPCASKLRS